MTRKLRRKAKSPRPAAAPTTLRSVRLHKDEAMHLMELANDEGLEAAKTHLRSLRPRLSEDDVHEVAWRCQDPRARGGIQTGADVDGPYADIAITE